MNVCVIHLSIQLFIFVSGKYSDNCVSVCVRGRERETGENQNLNVKINYY